MMVWIFQWLSGGAQSAAFDVVLATMVSSSGFVDMPQTPDESGIASRFGRVGDKHIGGNLKCRPDERVSLTEHQCAHRRYRCGTILVVENQRNGNKSWCEVVDSGPYGANVFTADGTPVLADSGKKAWYVKKRRNHRPPEDLCPDGGCVGRWRGILDMSPAVSKDLGHNGFEKIRTYKISSVTRYLKYLLKKSIRPLES